MGSCLPKEEVKSNQTKPQASLLRNVRTHHTAAHTETQNMYNVRNAMRDAMMVGGFLGSKVILEEKIRRARAELKIVTVANGCLFIDYQYQGRLPPGMVLQL